MVVGAKTVKAEKKINRIFIRTRTFLLDCQSKVETKKNK